MKEMIARVGDYLKENDIESICITQTEIIRCKNCKWYSLETSWCNNSMSPKEQTFFCADGKNKDDSTIIKEKKDILFTPVIGYYSWLCRRCFSRIIEGQKVCDCCGYGIKWS